MWVLEHCQGVTFLTSLKVAMYEGYYWGINKLLKVGWYQKGGIGPLCPL